MNTKLITAVLAGLTVGAAALAALVAAPTPSAQSTPARQPVECEEIIAKIHEVITGADADDPDGMVEPEVKLAQLLERTKAAGCILDPARIGQGQRIAIPACAVPTTRFLASFYHLMAVTLEQALADIPDVAAVRTALAEFKSALTALTTPQVGGPVCLPLAQSPSPSPSSAPA